MPDSRTQTDDMSACDDSAARTFRTLRGYADPPLHDVARLLDLAIRWVEDVVADALRSEEVELALTMREVRVVLVCRPAGTSICELREREPLSRQGLHAVVRRLVDAGLLVRDWHETTGEPVVRLTGAGARLARHLRIVLSTALEEAGPVLHHGSRGLLEDLQTLVDDRPLHVAPPRRRRARRGPGGPNARVRPTP